MHGSPFAVVSLLLGSQLVGQSWQQLAPNASPPPRYAHAMATDSAAGRVVLFGGLGTTAYLADTWEFDGVSWVQQVATGPSVRGQHAMAFDPVRGVTVLYGGNNGPGVNGYLGDTWEYSGGAWQQRFSSGTFQPQARFAHAFAYDAARQRVVMFGGRGRSTALLGDTWEWDGTRWTPIATVVAPSPRTGACMASDPITGQAVLFGGIQAGGYAAPITWTWDGANWTALTTAHSPSSRTQAVMANDAGGARVVLYGGSNGIDLVDTWQWDGVDWQQQIATLEPGVPALPAMSGGPTGRHVVLFGGQDVGGAFHQATWRNGLFAQAVPFGTGCGAPAVTLAAEAGSVPILGQTFRSRVANVPVSAAAFMSYGFDRTQLAGLPLPLDLGFASMPGCWLYHDLFEAFLACTDNGNGTATHVAAVPNVPALEGVRVYLQAYVLGVAANPAGIVTTNALALILAQS